MALPPDACSLIAKYAAGSRSTLVALSTVSKQFQTAAERAIYNTLDVRGYDRTITVCDVLRHTPRVAMLVVALSVYGEAEANEEEDEEDEDEAESEFEPESDYWQVLHQALVRTTRLRFLNLYFTSGDQPDKAWILDGCTFQLKTFHSDLIWDDHLATFLATQARLCNLFLADYREPAADEMAPPVVPASAGFLPKLAVLECTFAEAAVSLVPGRPVVRVKTCFTHSKLEEKRAELRAIVAALRRSRRRLRALDIADSSYTPAFTLELLAGLTADGALCADLRYVGTLVFPVDGRQRLEFYGMLMRLRHLRCLEVDVSEWDPPPTHFAALRALTFELLLYCPSVSMVIFVYEFERHLVRVVDHAVVYDEDGATENLWREV
ncbi:hypothetical protein GSI_02711 [Ganoderma sinense ZZ0214-1]|uniref:F-box domain-containing protein n=1 Tax=Ganoderma sinense ZZ0214-1 TaxID=1077348 RepID=A0A2G8SMC5_9APHY|nr:hypothetical protein GSI_02711 [Ganoderma sinense ZZ0214-1]